MSSSSIKTINSMIDATRRHLGWQPQQLSLEKLRDSIENELAEVELRLAQSLDALKVFTDR